MQYRNIAPGVTLMAIGLLLASTTYAFDMGNMMNPSKWMGGNNDSDRYDDYDYGYGGPGYGYGGYPGYGYGGYGYGGYGYGGYGGPGYGYGGYGGPGYGYGGYGARLWLRRLSRLWCHVYNRCTGRQLQQF